MKLGIIALLSLLAVMPTSVSSVECWKCADPEISAHRSLVPEIRLSSGQWNPCDKPELRECLVGCYEARVTLKNGNTGFVRDCANDKIMNHLRWNGTNAIPERKTDKGQASGRMCTLNRCNRFLSGPSSVVEFFGNNQGTITIIVLIGLICIPACILGCRCFYKRMKSHDGYMSPSEQPINYCAV